MPALPNGATAQLPMPFPEAARPSPELLRAHQWRAFTLDHDEAIEKAGGLPDAAARAFTQQYGVPPAFIVEAWGILYVGPIPQEASHV